MESKAASKGAKNTFKNHCRLLHFMTLTSLDQIMFTLSSLTMAERFCNFCKQLFLVSYKAIRLLRDSLSEVFTYEMSKFD